jgi:hypothetical protein
LNWFVTSDDDTYKFYDFVFAMDFGMGSGWFYNGDVYMSDQTDIWWGGSNWGDENKELRKVSIRLACGMHTLEIYGEEHCCDGV